MNASSAAYELIKTYEGLKRQSYPDPETGGEPWTIGYGTTVYPTGEKVCPGDRCRVEEAYLWMIHHVEENCEKPLNDMLKVPVNQPMFDALTSWTYNVGADAMRGSTLIRLLNAGDYLAARDEFKRWNRAGGHVSHGLENRRLKEEVMFTQGTNEAIAFAKDQGLLPGNWDTA